MMMARSGPCTISCATLFWPGFSAMRESSGASRPWRPLTADDRLLERVAAAKAQVMVGVALLVHHACPVPEGRAPAAPVVVGPVGIKDEPAAFHLGVPQFLTAS